MNSSNTEHQIGLSLDNAVKCKHRNGWSLIDNVHAYVYPNGLVELDFTKRNKLVFTCNNTCGATRNIYVNAKVKRYGIIKLHPLVKERKILKRLIKK